MPGTVEDRVARLEGQMVAIDSRINHVEEIVGGVRSDVAAIRTDVQWIKAALEKRTPPDSDRESGGINPRVYMWVIMGLLIVILSLLGVQSVTGFPTLHD